MHSGAAFAELQVRPSSLEEAFLTLTTQNLTAQPGEPTAVRSGATR